MHAEESPQLAAPAVGVEQPRRTPARSRALLQECRPAFLIRQQQFGRLQPRDFGFQRVVALDLVDQEAATGQVRPGQPVARAPARDRHEQRVAAFVEQGLVGHRAGRHHAHHLAFHQALGQCGIADLFADRHRFAQRHKSGQVALAGMHRHPGHRDGRAPGTAALGQRDVEQPRGLACVVVEQFVEVPHPEEQQQVRVIRLGGEELLHQGRVFRLVFAHEASGDEGAKGR